MGESHIRKMRRLAGGKVLSFEAGDDGPESPPVNLPAGDIQFFDDFIPPLEDGTYQVTITQEVNEVIDSATNVTQPLTDPYVQQQYFTVLGPRFTLQAAEVYSVFPPSNSLANYTGVMPHIVLNKRTLPWERTLDGLNPTLLGEPTLDGLNPTLLGEPTLDGLNPTLLGEPTLDGLNPNQPWLALLLFEDDEIIGDSPPGGNGSSTKTQSLPLLEVINLPTSGPILGPQNIVLGASESTSPPDGNCLVIDIDPQTFVAIAPELAELPLLAHVREVNTGNKEINGINADGWYSVVVSNRTVDCQPQSPGGTGTLNIAHLVSLEGLAQYLPSAQNPNPFQSLPNIERVRLVSLASWTFSCVSEGLNFRNLMQALDIGLPQLSAATSPPHFSPPAASPPVDAQATVQAAYQLGYVPLNYLTMQGEQTVAWCHGPLVPFATERTDRPPFRSVDEAKIYDENTGMFDLSLAVAWQIGRLLALADKEFSVALLNWQREVNYLINLIVSQAPLRAKFANVLSLRDPDTQRVPVDRHLIRRAFVTYLRSTFAEKIAPEDPDSQPLFGIGRDLTGIRPRRHEMRGLFSEREVEELLALGEDPVLSLHRKIQGR